MTDPDAPHPDAPHPDVPHPAGSHSAGSHSADPRTADPITPAPPPAAMPDAPPTAHALTEAEVQALIDDRLPPARMAAAQAALAADPALAARIAAQRADRAALRAALAPIAAEPVPERLRRAARPPQGEALAPLRRLAAALALVALGATLGAGGSWQIARLWPDAPGAAAPMQRLATEAQLAHAVYSVEVAHPVEVSVGGEPDAQSHLMAWLSKRLGHPLQAPDLGAQGFALIGGRLLPADQGAAAQLMYEDASGQRITLYVAATPAGETAFRFREGPDGTASLIWAEAGLGFALSGPMDRDTLWPLAEAAYHALSL